MVCAAAVGLTGCGSTAAAVRTTPEAAGGPTHTWTDYHDAGGTAGPTLAGGHPVGVTCRLRGFAVADGDTWWYRIAAAPWDDRYYASADAFYNDGRRSGSLKGTPFFDPKVPEC